MDAIKIIEEPFKKEITPFRIGDTIKVTIKVFEGNKERLQAYIGYVIARKGSGIRETITVRKISGGIGVERIFPLHSPIIHSISVVKKGKVRRAKLYYIRYKKGKEAKL